MTTYNSVIMKYQVEKKFEYKKFQIHSHNKIFNQKSKTALDTLKALCYSDN